MKKLVLVLMSAGMILSLSAFAAGESGVKDPISPNGGSDSCGLGWQVTQAKTLVGTSTRGTTNAYLSPTWSMTSGTSGCEKHDFAKQDEEAVKFAASNFYPLRAEMAQGQGEYLSGLARTMGCSDSAVESFSAAAQKNFRSITQGTDAYGMIQNVKQEIRRNPALAQGCAVTG